MNYLRKLLCKIKGHKYFISLYTDYKARHCSRCSYCEVIKSSNDIFDALLLIRKLENKYNIELTVSKESLIYIQNINNIKTTIKEIKEIKRNINHEKSTSS